jgi:hypothetical protein
VDNTTLDYLKDKVEKGKRLKDEIERLDGFISGLEESPEGTMAIEIYTNKTYGKSTETIFDKRDTYYLFRESVLKGARKVIADLQKEFEQL